jgi:FkbM family methyltransferase
MRLINIGDDLGHILDTDLIDDNSIIIDAGANVGEFIDKMRTMTSGKIYAIECSSYNCKVLREKKYKSVKIYEGALVGTKEKKVVLTEYSGEKKADGHPRFNQWCNIYGTYEEKFSKDPTVKVRKYEVKTFTLSKLIKNNKLKSIDYLKMDVEGAEYEIIKNLSKKDADIIKQISMEPHDDEKNAEMVERLESLGFTVHAFRTEAGGRVDEYYAHKPKPGDL